jgi:hypothetical protein
MAAALARRTLPEIAAEVEARFGGLGAEQADNVVPLFGAEKTPTLERLEAIEAGDPPTVQEARTFVKVFEDWPIGHFLRNREQIELTGIHVAYRDLGCAPSCACGAMSTLLCDGPALGEARPTCDEPICSACARVVGEDRHLCKLHGPGVRL